MHRSTVVGNPGGEGGLGVLAKFFWGGSLETDTFIDPQLLEIQGGGPWGFSLILLRGSLGLWPISFEGVLGVLAKFFWGGYLGLSENFMGSSFSCFIVFLFSNFVNLIPVLPPSWVIYINIALLRNRNVNNLNWKEETKIQKICFLCFLYLNKYYKYVFHLLCTISTLEDF